jgi:hypothetical protein
VVRRALVSLAFSTWCFLNSWIALADRRTAYFLRHDPAWTVVPQVLGCEIVLAAAMLAAWEICRKIPGRRTLIEGLFLIACLVPAGMVAMALVRLSPVDLTAVILARSFWPVAFAVAVVPVAWVALHINASAQGMRSILLWSWPAIGLILLQAAFGAWRSGSAAYSDLPNAPRLPARSSGPRAVWIIFDELSQTIAYRNRPRGLDLPNFDRLKNESFYATSAFSPGEATLFAMPALILGEEVTEVKPDGPARLLLTTRAHPQWFSFAAAGNVFEDARAAGFNTAVAGWYHPYGRLLNRNLTDCYWTANAIEPGLEESFETGPFPAAMLDRARLQLSNLPLAGHLAAVSPLRHQREAHARDFADLMRHALAMAADPDIGLLLIHLPVPHPPAIYNRASGRIDTEGPHGYLDNVALADRAMGELRGKMEQAGLWDRSAVIVSADHGWRVNLWRPLAGWTAEDETLAAPDTMGVPFLVKMPGQRERVAYEKPFDTVVTRNILNAILQQRLEDPRAIPAWLENEGTAAAAR